MEEKGSETRAGDSSSKDSYSDSKKDGLSVGEIASLLLSAIYGGVPVAA